MASRGGQRPGAGRKPKSREAKRRPTSVNLPPRTVTLFEEIARISLQDPSRSDLVVLAGELLDQAVRTLLRADHPEGWEQFGREARLLAQATLGTEDSNRKSNPS